MFVDLSILVVSAAVIVGAVRLLLIPGIGKVGAAFGLSAKTRGQIIGYATSVPEFTVVVAGALAGVFDAGMWNIASSNIINWVLFLVIIFAYKQQRDLLNAVFIDELVFGALSVAVPLVMFALAVGTGLWVALGLLGLFVVYKILDRALNKPALVVAATFANGKGGLWAGAGLMIPGILLILLAGRFLGNSANALVVQLKVPAWAVGWILGLITSIPEMTSFREIYRLRRTKDGSQCIADTQEALDALVASNVSNLGLILPLGMIVYLMVC